MNDRRIRLMVSSAVFGQEAMLDQVFAILTGYGFEVWMSYKGTIPLIPGNTAIQNCLAAVDSCDVFLGIITGRYGSGRDENGVAFTHREIACAVDLEKPRYFAVHRDVVIARDLLDQFLVDEAGAPREHGFFKPTSILDDIRILEMYDRAIRAELPLEERRDNWAQQFASTEDLLLFLKGQFSDPVALKARLRIEEPLT